MALSLKTWDETNLFDKIIAPKERRMIMELDAESGDVCPYLKRIKKFYYCEKDINTGIFSVPEYFNPIYRRHVGIGKVNMFCMENLGACCYKVNMENVDFAKLAPNCCK